MSMSSRSFKALALGACLATSATGMALTFNAASDTANDKAGYAALDACQRGPVCTPQQVQLTNTFKDRANDIDEGILVTLGGAAGASLFLAGLIAGRRRPTVTKDGPK
jgi:hypothetical protein